MFSYTRLLRPFVGFIIIGSRPAGTSICGVVLLHFVPEVAKLRLEFKLLKKTVFPASQHLILRKRQARLYRARQSEKKKEKKAKQEVGAIQRNPPFFSG